MKCVYAFELSNSLVKIGVTGNLKNRSHTVEFDSQAKVLNVHHTSFCEDKAAYMVESACHKTFADRRAGGEYFAISFEEACAELNRHEAELEDWNIKVRIGRAIFKTSGGSGGRRRFACKVGFPTKEILDFEECRKVPSVVDIVKIATACDVSTDYLLGRSDTPRPATIDKEWISRLTASRDLIQSILRDTGQVPAQ